MNRHADNNEDAHEKITGPEREFVRSNGIANPSMYGFSWVIEDKLAGHSGPNSLEDLIWLKYQGIQALVRLVETAGVSQEEIEGQGFDDCHEPVKNYTAPRQEQIDRILLFIEKAHAQGKPVGVSCGAGIGRTGTILACYLAGKGMGAEEAIQEIRTLRHGSIETDDQEEAVRSFVMRKKARDEE
ncbi:MAG: dual specificity protein phosphatase family protein [Candidatus Xenobiia bacterium LiM19]